MNKTVVILGRQPKIGIAELESLYGSEVITPINRYAVSLNLEPDNVEFSRLGGSIKLAKILAELPSTNWATIEKYLADTIPQHLQYVPDGKLTVGLSVYGLRVSTRDIHRTGLLIKKLIKANGRPARIVPNNETSLSSAQVIHNKLIAENGWELLLIQNGTSTLLALTTNVQDINAYAARDQARPMRDAKVGMLPPKLAQIIINLANPGTGETVLDPFCGTGVVLQEALLIGRYAYGTDIEPRMIDYTRKNLEWLIGPAEQKLTVGDATQMTWEHFDTIACETYLGRPFGTQPDRDTLQGVIRDVDTIHRKFLQNVAKQTKSGFRMCIAVPAWWGGRTFKHLPTLDQLDQLGYTRLVFKHVEPGDLIYHREGQVVARELVVLVRK